MSLRLNIVSAFVRKKIGRLPACVRDIAVAWFKNLNSYVTEEGGSIDGLLDFDGIDDYVSFSPTPDVTGSKFIEFNAFISSSIAESQNFIFKTSSTDFIRVFITSGANAYLYVGYGGVTTPDYTVYLPFNSTYLDKISTIRINKTASSITSSTIDGNILGVDFTGVNVDYDNQAVIGRSSRISGTSITYFEASANCAIWNININDASFLPGFPEGNQDSAWADTIGSVVGTVYGSPTTTSIGTSSSTYVKDSIGARTDDVYYGQYLDVTSGQINFYRTSGTFDYTDPSDGTLVETVSIPTTGLYTIPINGICDIVTSDGSEYPACERAGTVLHDVMENSIHISVDTPVWSESLYGSDYLNQQGFVTKAESDALSYDWETLVDGSDISLNDNTLVPLAQWDFSPLTDSEGETITDSEGEIIYVKDNI